MAKKHLTDFENDSLVTIARIRAEFLVADGVSLDDETNSLSRELEEMHARYGSAGLQAYREYMAMANHVTGLREMVMISFAEVDGFVDYGSAIKDKPHLRPIYAKYSGAVVKAIIMTLIYPVRITVEEGDDKVKTKNDNSKKDET